MFTRKDSIGRRGEARFGAFVDEELDWMFRPAPPPDWGIDGEIETMKRDPRDFRKTVDRDPTGRLLKVQIKSTESDLRNKVSFNVYVDELHLDYWKSVRIPVLLVAVSLQGGVWWHHIDPQKKNYKTDRGAWVVNFNVSDDELTKEKKLAIEQLTDSRQLRDAELKIDNVHKTLEEWEQRFAQFSFENYEDADSDLDEALHSLEDAKALLESDPNADGWELARDSLRRATNKFEMVSFEAKRLMSNSDQLHRFPAFPELRQDFRSGILSAED